jgi:hypothetical protein
MATPIFLLRLLVENGALERAAAGRGGLIGCKVNPILDLKGKQ